MPVLEILAGLLFVVSSGIFFNERFRHNRIFVVCAGLIAVVSTGMLFQSLFLAPPASIEPGRMTPRDGDASQSVRNARPTMATDATGQSANALQPSATGSAPVTDVVHPAQPPAIEAPVPEPRVESTDHNCDDGDLVEDCRAPAVDVALEPDSGGIRRIRKSGHIRTGPGHEYPAIDDIVPRAEAPTVRVVGRVAGTNWYRIKWSFSPGFLGRWPAYVAKYYSNPRDAEVYVAGEMLE